MDILDLSLSIAGKLALSKTGKFCISVVDLLMVEELTLSGIRVLNILEIGLSMAKKLALSVSGGPNLLAITEVDFMFLDIVNSIDISDYEIRLPKSY